MLSILVRTLIIIILFNIIIIIRSEEYKYSQRFVLRCIPIMITHKYYNNGIWF